MITRHWCSSALQLVGNKMRVRYCMELQLLQQQPMLLEMHTVVRTCCGCTSRWSLLRFNAVDSFFVLVQNIILVAAQQFTSSQGYNANILPSPLSYFSYPRIRPPRATSFSSISPRGIIRGTPCSVPSWVGMWMEE